MPASNERGRGLLHRAGSKRRTRFRLDSLSPSAASISAVMFEPRPEIKIATRFFMSAVAQRGMTTDRDARESSTTGAAAAGDRLRPAARRSRHSRRIARRLLRRASASSTAIMPMPQLNVRSISCSLTPPAAASHLNTGRTGTRSRSMLTARPSREHARNVFDKPAAGDVGERLDRSASRGSRRGTIAHKAASA